MATTTTPRATSASNSSKPAYAGKAHELSPVLDQKYAANWKHAAVCAWFVVLFMYTNHAPLFHTEVWRNASIGRTISQSMVAKPARSQAANLEASGAVMPSANPAVPLVAGMPQTQSGWFSKVAMAHLLRFGGSEALSTVSTLLVMTMFVAWAILFFKMSGQKRFMLLGLTLLAGAWFSELNVPGPRMAGGLCFAVLLGLISKAAPWRVLAQSSADESLIAGRGNEFSFAPARWISVALVMCLWANFDSSFLVGLCLLFAIALGHVYSTAYSVSERRFQNPFQFRQVRNWVCLFEIGLLATLLNPEGIGLWRSALGHWGTQSAGNPIWLEWGGTQPLRLTGAHGIVFVALWITTVFVWRRSRSPIAASELTVLGVFSIFVAFNANLLIWFAPVAVLICGKHWRNATGTTWVSRIARTRTRRDDEAARPLRFGFSLVCLLLVWIGFALSPMSSPILQGTPRAAARRHTAETPLLVSAYLKGSDASDTIWAPSYWADWLIWDGPQAAKYYTDSHVWQLPKRSQLDYGRIYRGEGNWQRIADRYAIHTLVVDKQKQLRLASEVMRSGNKWKTLYEDDRALVMSRIGI